MYLPHTQAPTKPVPEKNHFKSSLRAAGGVLVRTGRCFLGSQFLRVGAKSGVNSVKAPLGTAVLFQIVAEPHNFYRILTVVLGS